MNIAELENKIRDRVGRRRTQHALLGRRADWNRLCSALDVIGDTELGLDSYLAQSRIENLGLRYVQVYGVLQLLQTQQDAAVHICHALGIKPHNSPKLPHIRMIRSDSVAHPAAQRENRRTKSNFIVQNSLSRHGFELMTLYSDGTPHSQRYIDIPCLIAEQRKVLQAVLEEVLEKMDEAEMKHRSKHSGEKLQEVFPAVLPYYFSKIFEAIHSPASFALGGMHVDLVASCLDRLKLLLEKRGEWGIHDSVNYQYELLEYPLAELRAFFRAPAESKLNSKDAYIFCAFVREQLNTVQEIAKEFDDAYASGPVEE